MFSSLREAPIREALTGDAVKRRIGAHAFIHAFSLPLVVSEVKLRQIQAQVMLGAMLIHATHTYFEGAEITLNGDRGYIAAHVVTRLLADAF